MRICEDGSRKNDLSHNTALKYIANLRKIVKNEWEKGNVSKYVFSRFKWDYEETDPTHLDLFELKRIEEYNFSTIPRLDRVRDCFVFCCYTGLAFSDAEKLSYASDFALDNDGDVWLVQERTKTEVPARILLMPKAVEILLKYEDHPDAKDGKALPTITNQKTNAYLKEIADVCGIKKNLTTHVARHTFGTTITLANGMPMGSVQVMMGHKRRKTTEHYARVTNLKLRRDMKVLRDRLQELRDKHTEPPEKDDRQNQNASHNLFKKYKQKKNDT